MNTLKKLFVLCSFLYIPFSSMAWGVLGHRIIGQIADSYLTSKARRNIKAILGDESIAMSSNWADFIKSDASYNYLGPWHYLNVKDNLDEQAFKNHLSADTLTDAYTKLNFIIGELKKPALENDKKKLYLRLLIHIAGDIHQPMHVSRAEDQGGNKISLLWFNESSNLHRLWDEQLIGFQQLSYTEYTDAINHTTRQERKEWQQQPMQEWFFESYQISQGLYKEITQPDQKLSFRYNFDHIAIVNQQLLKAGVRLAGILNELFG